MVEAIYGARAVPRGIRREIELSDAVVAETALVTRRRASQECQRDRESSVTQSRSGWGFMAVTIQSGQIPSARRTATSWPTW